MVGTEFDKGRKVLKTSSPIFYRLMENQEFVNLVRNRWNEKSDAISSTILSFSQMTLQNTLSYKRNFQLWTKYSVGTFEQNVASQNDWLQKRIAWLTENDWKVQ